MQVRPSQPNNSHARWEQLLAVTSARCMQHIVWSRLSERAALKQVREHDCYRPWLMRCSFVAGPEANRDTGAIGSRPGAHRRGGAGG